jgi:hypothetical protein
LRPPKFEWPKTIGSQGVLMVAQLFTEMLTPHTFSSFRVYSLDTLARLKEAGRLIADIERGQISELALKPLLAELCWSLDKDPVAKAISEREVIAFQEKTRGTYQLSEINSYLVLLHKRISAQYKSAIEKKIIEVFSEQRRRIELRQACGFYCSHLINLGYSKQYIAEQVYLCFFATKLLRVGAGVLRKFFSRFDGKKRQFQTFTVVDAAFGKFLAQLHFKIVDQAHLPPSATAAVQGIVKPTDLMCMSKDTAYDEYGALADVSDTLSSVRAITFLAPQGLTCRWDDTMFVMRTGGTGSLIKKPPISFDRPTAREQSGRSFKGILAYSGRIIGNFDSSSLERLFSSINTHSLARTSTSIENQLISLWSAIEVLLSEPKGVARIVHYVRLLESDS